MDYRGEGPKKLGALFGSPYKKDVRTLGSSWGPLHMGAPRDVRLVRQRAV